MRQLTYISTATRDIAEAQVNEVLRVSRIRNAVVGVTGLLLYDGRRFLQALEGADEAVVQTYERIARDPRHRAVVMLSSREVSDRAFGQWAMAGQRSLRMAAATTLADEVDALTAEVEDANVRELFRSFARVRSAA